MDLQQWYFKIITTLEELFSLVELCTWFQSNAIAMKCVKTRNSFYFKLMIDMCDFSQLYKILQNSI